MSRRLPTSIAVVQATAKRPVAVVLALANDGTLWETPHGSGRWTLCQGLPQGEWGTGAPAADPTSLGPNEWGSPEPPKRVEEA